MVSSNKPKGKGEKKRCRVADEPVVVMNPLPGKAGNRPKDKTEGTVALSGTESLVLKVLAAAKGRKQTKVYDHVTNEHERRQPRLKCQGERGYRG